MLPASNLIFATGELPNRRFHASCSRLAPGASTSCHRHKEALSPRPCQWKATLVKMGICSLT